MLLMTAFLLLAVLAAAPPALPSKLAGLLQSQPPDALVGPLRRFEVEHAQGGEAGEAAWILGQLHFARGEYRQASDAFGRAAAKLAPERKPAARYWAGLSWLALKQPEQARAALDEAARSDPALKAPAQLGIALAWELSERPEQALTALEGVLARDPGEAGPAALERQVALAERLNRPELARRARERLRRQYPKSIEAARASMPAPIETPEAAGSGTMTVQIGAFADPARARSLVESAQRGGFPSAQVVVRGEGAARMHIVTLGVFGTREDATRAGERAALALGVTYQVSRYP